MAQFNVRISVEMRDKIRKEAARRELDWSDIMREALREYFERREKKPVDVRGMDLLIPVEEKVKDT